MRQRPLARLAAECLGAVLDATIVFSFDRTGFRVHSLAFRSADLEVDLAGRVCLITGANSGLGRASAEGLARLGAEVWLLCRNADRAAEAAAAIRRATGSRRVKTAQIDVANLASVRAFAASFPRERVDVLVHNAGVLPARRSLTSEGLELTFATHVVGPFLLTHLLVPKLEAAAAARVIHVSSGGMYTQRLDLERLPGRRGRFDGVIAYAQSKRAEVILAELWAERLADRGVMVHSMHPGWADTPAVRSSIPRFHRLMRPLLRTPAEGADTIVWLAACPRIPGASGRFFFDRRARRTHLVPWTRETPEDRAGLWQLCTRFAGVASAPTAGRRVRSGAREARS